MKISDPILVYAPEMKGNVTKWGAYAIPRMWRDKNGELVIRFNGEADSADTNSMHCLPNLYFVSRDDGETWESKPDGENIYDISILTGIDSPYLTLKNGEKLFFQYKKNCAPIENLTAIKEIEHPCGEAIMRSYFYGDIPNECKGVSIGKIDKNGNTVQHRYGCSGIDGVTFGPIPGDTESNKMYLYVAYGIYGDVDRNDNNNQILLCYDTDMLNSFAQRLDQKNMHTSGPEKPLHKYFVYTGNTVYGVQNLEYDRYTKAFLMAVYKGKKTEFPNYSLFAVDACRAAEIKTPAGLNEKAEILYLKQTGLYDKESGISGWHFPYGSTGLYSFGDGNWLISHNQSTPEGQCSYIHHYIWNDLLPFELNNKK